ncbi:MAG TPA: ATP-binding protein [Bryobacteraceae bacterium]|nr:ATP-binding protein [Bryobacteraceae bacterium]
MTARIFAKLIAGVVCVLVIALFAVDFLVSRIAEDNYTETLTLELNDKARLVAELAGGPLIHLSQERARILAKAAGARLTVVDIQGHVLADSESDAATMANHRSRPEIAAALNGRTGSSVRLSPTIGVNFLYVAIPMPGGALRLAVPMKDIRQTIGAVRKRMLAATVFAFLPAILIAALFARHFSSRLAHIIDYAKRLSTGDFQARMEVKNKDELGILSARLNETAAKLEKMFDEIQREQAALRQLERVRTDFVINVSHELRTPLASIQGYTETLLDGALDDPAHNVRFLSIIRQNAERLGRIIADLMTISRLELKTQKFQFASYSVNGLLSDAVDALQPIAEKKNISLVMEPAPADAEVFCDSEAVQQILINLLDNAVKYTPQNGTITVGAKPPVRRAGHDEIALYVRDNGIGIPAQDLPRLFERFYRVDKARSRELGGTGLGLAIAKHLVRAQGGEIGVESELNKGSVFFFTLPVQDLGLLEAGEVQTELTAL